MSSKLLICPSSKFETIKKSKTTTFLYSRYIMNIHMTKWHMNRHWYILSYNNSKRKENTRHCVWIKSRSFLITYRQNDLQIFIHVFATCLPSHVICLMHPEHVRLRCHCSDCIQQKITDDHQNFSIEMTEELDWSKRRCLSRKIVFSPWNFSGHSERRCVFTNTQLGLRS